MSSRLRVRQCARRGPATERLVADSDAGERFLSILGKSLRDAFDEMKLKKGQVGIVSGIMWTDRDGEMRSHPMVTVFNTRG